jgi:uncharacterized protein YeaO (DUF488 family)
VTIWTIPKLRGALSEGASVTVTNLEIVTLFRTLPNHLGTKGGSKMTEQHVTVALKRIYDEPASSDGMRVLVERLWPRGLSKERAHIDLWLKEVAPSHEFVEFRRRYEAELASGAGQRALAALRDLVKQGPLTLVFAAHDTEHTNAVVLRDLLSRNNLSNMNER